MVMACRLHFDFRTLNIPLWIKTVYSQSCISLTVMNFWAYKSHWAECSTQLKNKFQGTCRLCAYSCVFLGKSIYLCLCLWWPRALTVVKLQLLLFLSIYKPGVTVPVSNHFKVLRTPFSVSFCCGNSPGFVSLFSRDIGLEVEGAGSGFTYYFLPIIIYSLFSSYPILFLPSPFKLYLIASMHFASYPPPHHFPKTIVSPRKCNKAHAEKGSHYVWTGWW